MAYALDGVNDEIQPTPSLALSDVITNAAGSMCAWYKPTGTPSQNASVWLLGCIFGDGKSLGGFAGLARGESPAGTDRIWAHNWDGNSDKVGFTYTNDVWVHCGWMHSGGTLSVYKDGVLAGSTPSGNTSTLTAIMVTGPSRGNTDFLEGDIAEIAAWNVALTDDEWAALGKGVSPALIRPQSLKGYWPLRGGQSPEIQRMGPSPSVITGATAIPHLPIWYPAFPQLSSQTLVLPDIVVQTLAATGVRSTQARIRGRIDPNGVTATGWFEWGLASASPSLTNTTSPTHSVGSGTFFITFGDLIEGLEPNTEYVYRAVGNDGTDDVFGEILSFTTLGEQVFIDGDVSHPLTWMELTDRDEELHVYAEVDLNDPPSYYGGYKAPLVLSWKPITRGFSDRTGQVEHMAFGAVLSDVSREFRGFLADPTKRYLTNRPLLERMVDDEERRALGLPRVVANGYVSDYEPQSPLRFSLTGCDWLKKKFSRKATAQRAWQPTVTLDDFPNANAEIVADNGSVLKVNAVGKACPLVYGKVSDVELTEVEVISPGTGSRLVLDPTLPNAGEFGGNAYGIVGASSFAVGQNIRYGYTIVDTDTNEEGPFTRIAGTMVMEFPADHHTAFCFNPIAVPGRNIKYRVYMFDGWFNPNTGDSVGNTFVRWKEHDDSTVDGFFIYAASGFGVEFTGPADGNDWASEGSPSSEFVSIDRGKGALTPIYVGDTIIDGVLYRTGLVSRGACADLIAGYVNGVAVDLTTSTEWLTFKNAAAWAAAGFSDPFVEINSRRYTLVYLSGVAGNLLAGVTSPVDNEVGIALNVWGIEDIGDGSGDVITSLAQQYKHFVRNFLAPDTAPGTDWLATCPTFPNLPDLTLVDETSFDVVDDETFVRLPAVGSPGTDGYEGAFMIGANGELESALDVVAAFNVNLDANGTFTRRGQYQITMEPSEAPADPAVVDDIISIVEDSFSIHDDVSGEFFNILPYVHTRDYTGRTDSGWFSTDLGDVDVRDTDSITFYDQEREAPQFELSMLRATTAQGAATIADVMQHKLARYRHPFRTAVFSVPLSGTHIEIGDIFRASHIEGIGATGWSGRLVRTMRHELDPNMNRVRLGVYDVEPLLGSGSP